jgi:hypothetical protein
MHYTRESMCTLPPGLYQPGNGLSDEAPRRITVCSERKVDRAQMLHRGEGVRVNASVGSSTAYRGLRTRSVGCKKRGRDRKGEQEHSQQRPLLGRR